MGRIIKADVVEDSYLRTQGTAIMEAVRGFIVGDIVYAGQEHLALYNAQTTTGIPNPWNVFPNISDLRCVAVDVRPFNNKMAKVLCKYLNVSPQLNISGGTSLMDITTDIDVNRKQIVVYHNSVKQPAAVSVRRPISTFSISCIQANAPYGGISPVQKQQQYSGKLIYGPLLDVLFPRYTVLCESVSFDNSGLGNVAWNMTYEFIQNPFTWLPDVVFRDWETGAPVVNPKDAGFTPQAADSLEWGRKLVKDMYLETPFYF